MNLRVKKFGGTSVKNLALIKKIALSVKEDIHAGYQVIVVVSAMGNFTDDIILQINQISTLITSEALSEHDMIVSSGEQISSGLLALALQNIGIKARSWLGWQIPITTTNFYSRGKIINIDTTKLEAFFQHNDVAVIAGFQGVYEDRITTLGRGGSDTSAVSLAAALKLDYCEIYTDVDGIYTADPNIVLKATKIDYLTYDEMLEMSSLGAGVLHVRSVEIAKKYGITLRVLSTFKPGKGTIISNTERNMENHIITGITLSNTEASVTLKNVTSKMGIVSVFKPIASANINVDMIIQSMNCDVQDITFTVQESYLQETEILLIKNKPIISYSDLIINSNVAKISIIGVGMISNSGVAYQMFQILESNNIQVLAVTTSEIKISILIARDKANLAMNYLHQGFNLDKTNE